MKRMSSRRHAPSRLAGYAALALTILFGLLHTPAKIHATSVDECLDLHDSLRLCYTYQKASNKRAKALIVTLPMRGATRSSFTKIVEALSDKHPEVSFLNFDLRGHGQSTIRGSDTLSHLSMSRAEYTQIPHDIKAALRILRKEKKELRKLPIIMIGASIGANSAAILANIEDRVKAAAILSPGMDYLGLIPGPHVKMTDGKRLLYVVGQADRYSYISADSLHEITAGEKALHVYNSRYHGTNIPNNSKEALADLLEWIDETLVAIKK